MPPPNKTIIKKTTFKPIALKQYKDTKKIKNYSYKGLGPELSGEMRNIR